MPTSIRDDLLAIAGIESAELEGDADAPEEVRVRLQAGVDVAAVGEEIRKVLAGHGLHADVGGSTTQPAVHAVPTAGVAPEQPAPTPEPSPPPIAVEAPISASTGLVGLQSVAIEESSSGLTVVARAADGSRAMRRARSSGEDLDTAVVAAVAAVVAPEATPPLLLAVTEEEVEGSTVLTVVLDLARGRREAGSAVVEGGRAYAVGRAAWAALSVP